jgi:hypothetical protein
MAGIFRSLLAMTQRYQHSFAKLKLENELKI